MESLSSYDEVALRQKLESFETPGQKVKSMKVQVPEGSPDFKFDTPVVDQEAIGKTFKTPESVEASLEKISDEVHKAEEQAILAAAKQKEIEMHHAELVSLTKQAEELELESKRLFEEAEAERESVRRALEQVMQAEAAEQERFAQAEAIERERREAARLALPKLQSAEEANAIADELKLKAEDHEFHAQILENRAKSLLAESEQMRELAEKKQTEIDGMNAQIQDSLNELDGLEKRADDGNAGDLPAYILQCEKEMGMLLMRVNQLKEEIEWSRREIEKRKENGVLWNRLITQRRTALAQLKNKCSQLEDACQEAKDRAVISVREAQMPAKLAEKKFAIAADLRNQASEAAERAYEIQREAVESARRAVEIQKKREEILAEASKAEAEARDAERQAAGMEDKSNEHIQEANRKQAMATALKERAKDEIGFTKKIGGIHNLDQLHPMNLNAGDLLECPVPATPSVA